MAYMFLKNETEVIIQQTKTHKIPIAVVIMIILMCFYTFIFHVICSLLDFA